MLGNMSIVITLSVVSIIVLIEMIILMRFYVKKMISNSINFAAYEEIEIIRRHLPNIIKVIDNREIIKNYNQAIRNPVQANKIIYDFKKAPEIEKLSIYAVALQEEGYELLLELEKIVDEDFRIKVSVMSDIIKTIEK